MVPNPILTYLPLNGSLSGKDRNTGAFTATGSGAVRWSPAEGARINYWPDPKGMMYASTSYYGKASGVTLTQTTGSNGYYAVRATRTGASGGFGFYLNGISSSNVPLNAVSGHNFVLSFDIRANTNLQLNIDYYDNEQYNTATMHITSAWQRIVLDYSALYGLAFADIYQSG